MVQLCISFSFVVQVCTLYTQTNFFLSLPIFIWRFWKALSCKALALQCLKLKSLIIKLWFEEEDDLYEENFSWASHIQRFCAIIGLFRNAFLSRKFLPWKVVGKNLKRVHTNLCKNDFGEEVKLTQDWVVSSSCIQFWLWLNKWTLACNSKEGLDVPNLTYALSTGKP